MDNQEITNFCRSHSNYEVSVTLIYGDSIRGTLKGFSETSKKIFVMSSDKPTKDETEDISFDIIENIE